jgi:hypothetical protein
MPENPLPRRNRRSLLGAILTAGAAAAAISAPSIAAADQYLYMSVPIAAPAFGAQPEPADMIRINVQSGAVDNPWVANASFSNGSGGNDFVVNEGNRGVSSRFAVAGGYIYWTNSQDQKIGRMTTSGTDIRPDWVGLTTTPTGIDVADGYIYFSHDDGNAGGIGRVAVNGTGLNQGFVSSGVGRIPNALRAANGRLGWLQEGNQWYISDLYSCTIASCTPALVYDGDAGSNVVAHPTAFTGSAFFPSDNMNGAIMNVPVPSGTVTTNWWVPAAWSNLGASDTDGTDLFLTSFCNACALGSGGPITGVLRTSITAPVSNDAGANRWVALPIDARAAGNYLAGDLRVAAIPNPPAITGVSPANGTTAGGTTVTITGTNLTGATAVTFGGTAATSFTVDSPTQITAVTPARSAGAADVVVTTPDGTDTEAGAFLYQAPAPPAPPATPATPATPAAGNTQAPTSAWVPPSGPEDKAILINDARVDLAAPPAVTTQGNDTTVVTNMTVDEVGRYTVMYVAPKRVGNAIGEMASVTERVSFAKGTVINKRKLKRKYTAVTFTTTKQGAQVTMRALLKRAKGRKLTLRVIYKAADGTLKESRIKS